MSASIDMRKFRSLYRKKLRILWLAISCAILLCGLLASCRDNASSWYPAGKAEVVSFYELDTGGQELLTATIEVANTGKTGICSCSISISVKTTDRTYKKTFIRTIDIQPGGRVYFDVEILYSSAEERLAPEGLAIIGEFYY